MVRMAEEPEIRLVSTWEPGEIVRLYRAAGWWREGWDVSGLTALVEGSYAFAVAVEPGTERAVGMGRVISDGVSDAYVQDVVVLPEYRGLGIGCRIVEALIGRLLEEGIRWIGAVAVPGTEGFYASLGFVRMEGFVPMLYRGGGRDLPV